MIFYLKCMLVLFASTSFWANKTDDIKPKIELLSPEDTTQILPGSTLKLSAVLSDNIALDSYKIEISKGGTSALNFVKCFSCNHLISANVDVNGDPLPTIKAKLNAKLDIDIGVAEDALIGDYYLSIYVNDNAGNKVVKKINFMIARFL